MTGPGTLACGQPFRPATRGALTVVGGFPGSVPVGAGTVGGTVEITSPEPVRGVVASAAEVFLVRDGRVATLPMPRDAVGIRVDLGPGTPARLPAAGALTSCAPGGAPIGAGAYELYVRVVFAPDDGADTESFGGPWPLEVR